MHKSYHSCRIKVGVVSCCVVVVLLSKAVVAICLSAESVWLAQSLLLLANCGLLVFGERWGLIPATSH